MEEIQARHRKEQRELQSRITQKKKNATKKTRKSVNDECEALQRELQERQKAELEDSDSITADMKRLDMNGDPDELKNGAGEGRVAEKDASESKKELKDEPESINLTPSSQKLQDQPKRPNRQKARLARRAAEQDAQIAQAAEEAANLPDRRKQETAGMREQMEKRGLTEINVRPDGHCLYSAVATVLPPGHLSTINSSIQPYHRVRITTANFISDHPDDFVAFLEEPLEIYVIKIKDTAEWGGQLELQAIARAYAVQVNVLQADGHVEKFEPETKSKGDPLWLAYYRHSFGLGEHYNALKKTS